MGEIKCEACQFCVPNDQDKRLYCRRNPPVAAFHVLTQQSMNPLTRQPQVEQTPTWQCAFPQVRPDWWCGEFQLGKPEQGEVN